MDITTEFNKKLNELKFSSKIAEYNKCGYHILVDLIKDNVRDFAKTMLESDFYLDFVTAVHVESAFQVIYQFAKFEEPCRVNAKVLINSEESILTISDIFHGANWHEREAHDFYGINFKGHDDMRPLLLDEEDVDLKPLLKTDKKLKNIDDITRKNSEATEAKPKIKKKEDNKSPE
jgi:NADH-quinone oxidoreductase subunit C